MGKIFKRGLVAVGVVISALLAIDGYAIWSSYGISTPGILIARALVPRRAYPEQFQSFAQDLRIQMAVDWVFWFLLMWAVYLLLTRVGRSFGSRQQER